MYAAFLLMALGGWGPGGCPPVGGPRAAGPPPAFDHITTYEWRGFPGDPDQLALMRHGGPVPTFVGTYWLKTGNYYAFDPASGRWAAIPSEPPHPPPVVARAKEARPAPRRCADECDCRCTREGNCPCFVTRTRCQADCMCAKLDEPPPAGPDPPTGVDETKLGGRDRLSVGGREVDFHDFKFGDVPADDSRKPYLAVVGDEQFLALAKASLAPGGKYARLADPFVVGFFTPAEWHVRGVGLGTPARPGNGVSVFGPRRPDGTAVELSYTPALDDLGKAVERSGALREPSPKYDPARTPDLSKDPVIPPALNPANWPVLGWVAGGMAVLLLLSRKR